MSTAPEGMIPVAEFATKKNLTTERAIEMIRDGFYQGRLKNDEWYVYEDEVGREARKIDNKVANKSDYGTARTVSKLISALGWLVFVIGAATALMGFSEGGRHGSEAMLVALPGVALSIAGLFLVASGQITRATVDNADQTREILALMQNNG